MSDGGHQLYRDHVRERREGGRELLTQMALLLQTTLSQQRTCKCRCERTRHERTHLQMCDANIWGLSSRSGKWLRRLHTSACMSDRFIYRYRYRVRNGLTRKSQCRVLGFRFFRFMCSHMITQHSSSFPVTHSVALPPTLPPEPGMACQRAEG